MFFFCFVSGKPPKKYIQPANRLSLPGVVIGYVTFVLPAALHNVYSTAVHTAKMHAFWIETFKLQFLQHMEEVLERGGLERSENTVEVGNGSGKEELGGVDTKHGCRTKHSVAAGGIISYEYIRRIVFDGCRLHHGRIHHAMKTKLGSASVLYINAMLRSIVVHELLSLFLLSFIFLAYNVKFPVEKL